jgi:hypothetical protein
MNGVGSMSDFQEIFTKYTYSDGSYIPLQINDYVLLKQEINHLLDKFKHDPDQEVTSIAKIINLIFSHFDSISVLMEKNLNQIPIEVVKAIASSIYLDEGYFGNDPIISILFSPSDSSELDRIHLWERRSVPKIDELCRSFIMRIDLPKEVLDEIQEGLSRLEKY